MHILYAEKDSLDKNLSLCVCARMFVCVFVFVCVRACLCVCVCVCILSLSLSPDLKFRIVIKSSQILIKSKIPKFENKSIFFFPIIIKLNC